MSIPWTAAGGWLLHCAVGGGLLLLLACGCMKGTRQPARRQRLGECGLAAALVLAVLGLGPTWLEVPWPMPDVTMLSALPSAGRPQIAREGHFEEAWAPLAEMPAILKPDAGGNGQAPDDAVDEDGSPSASLSTNAFAEALAPAVILLVGAFLAGAAFFFGRWLLGHFVLARLLRRAWPAPEAVNRIFQDMVAGRPPRLLMSHDLRVPVSCGLLRPTVVLPATLCERPEADKLRLVLGHELTHVQRLDAWSSLLLGLGQALYFYVPLFWWLRRQVRLCQEYVADAAAVERGVLPADYAEFLLSLVPAPAVPAAATGVSGHGSDLYRRVTMLLQDPLRVEKHCPRVWSLGAAAGLLALAVVVAGVGIRPAEAAADEQPARADEAKAVKVIRVQVVGEPGEGKKGVVVRRFKDVVPAPGGVVVVEEISPARGKVIIEKVRKDEKDVPSEKRASGEPGILVKRIGTGTNAVKVIVNTEKAVAQAGAAAKKADAHLEAVRKALEKLENVPGVDVERIRKDILKALDDVNKATSRLRELDTKHLQRYDALIRQHTLKAEDLANLTRSRALRLEAATGPGRLGIEVEKPAAALADQLNLPKGQGLVITAVKEGSPAKKAGLKANDVLLELGGKPVTSTPGALPKALDALPADQTADAVVLRKGKRKTIEGLKVGAAEIRNRLRLLNEKAAPNLKLDVTVPDAKARKRRPDAADKASAAAAADGSVTVTTFRTGERFTTRYQEGNLVITVVGQGKQPSEITVQDGTVTHTYASVSDVPARYRDKVNHVIRSTTGGSVRIERD